jgi:hypothetical protein
MKRVCLVGFGAAIAIAAFVGFAARPLWLMRESANARRSMPR